MALRRLTAVLLVGMSGVVGVGAAAPVASAAEPGVTIDPGSPAGKEYALPVDRARHEAGGLPSGGGSGPSGGSGSGGASSGGGELFGAGVTPRGRRAGGNGSGTGGSSAPGISQRDASAAGIPAASSSGDSMTGSVLGIVAGVLLLGIVGGLGVRRLRTSGA
jgi:hypothetical protein